MLCCPNCIGDRWLNDSISSSHGAESGKCSYCQDEDVLLIKLDDLRNNFQSLVYIYSEDEGGKSLVEWLKSDWAMFPNMDVANAKQLLADILDDGEIVRKKFVPSALCETDQLNNWEQLKAELMHENRFFPSTKFDEYRLRELLDQLLVRSNEFESEWYRSRIQKEDKVFPVDEMGAPPKRLASQGRANPAGIPYLYLASNPETAVSEIRPHTGEFAEGVQNSVSPNRS
ncbi:RES domain-containing protein [Porticoccus sp. GXU_MW_L64]